MISKYPPSSQLRECTASLANILNDLTIHKKVSFIKCHVYFIGGGSSPDPCEEIYCGPKPFSESESLALARYLYKIRRKLISFIDIHTYGQLWMSPWGFTTGFPRDFARQVRMSMILSLKKMPELIPFSHIRFVFLYFLNSVFTVATIN